MDSLPLPSRWIVHPLGLSLNQRISLKLLISFNANPALYRQDNRYVISRQGKPPDLIMEIASRRIGGTDVRDTPQVRHAGHPRVLPVRRDR